MGETFECGGETYIWVQLLSYRSYYYLVKTILLDETAKKDEVTVVQIETTGYKDQKVIFFLFST